MLTDHLYPTIQSAFSVAQGAGHQGVWRHGVEPAHFEIYTKGGSLALPNTAAATGERERERESDLMSLPSTSCSFMTMPHHGPASCAMAHCSATTYSMVQSFVKHGMAKTFLIAMLQPVADH